MTYNKKDCSTKDAKMLMQYQKMLNKYYLFLSLFFKGIPESNPFTSHYHSSTSIVNDQNLPDS